MAGKSGKKGPEEREEREIRAPSPGDAPKKSPSYSSQRRTVIVAAILLAVIVISGIAFVGINGLKERNAIKKELIGYEKEINGTQIQMMRDDIQELVDSGTAKVAPKEEALLPQTKDYVCSVETDKGIIILKKRGSLMREEVMRSGHNLSVVFINDKLYMYHPQYNVWAMFPYDESKTLSDDSNTNMAFSVSELRAINESKYLCIAKEFPENEFSLGDVKVVDAVKFLEGIKFLR